VLYLNLTLVKKYGLPSLHRQIYELLAAEGEGTSLSELLTARPATLSYPEDFTLK